MLKFGQLHLRVPISPHPHQHLNFYMYIFYPIVILVDLSYDCIFCSFDNTASLLAQLVKNLPASAGDTGLIPGLVRKNLLEKKMATHSSILAWEIPQAEEPCGLQFMGLQKSRT